jgi:L-fuculose-phosphate aldolase
MPPTVTSLAAHTASDSAELQALKRDLLHAYHILDADGQSSGIAGHLTARLPGARTFWSHRWGLGFDEVTYDDLIEADFELATVTGEGRVNPTLNIHTQIYEVRPDVGCIVHTHGKNALALGAAGSTLEPVTQTGAVFYDDIAFLDEYEGVVFGKSEGDTIAEALGRRRGVLLKNHGALVVGANVRAATIAMLVLEFAAEVQLKAMAAGPLSRLPEAAALQAKTFLVSPEVIDQRFEHQVRRIRRDRPFLAER